MTGRAITNTYCFEALRGVLRYHDACNMGDGSLYIPIYLSGSSKSHTQASKSNYDALKKTAPPVIVKLFKTIVKPV